MTEKYEKWKYTEYTRTSKYFKPDNFIQILDPDGFTAFMKIVFAEPLGHFPILVCDELSPIPSSGAGVARPAGAPPYNPSATGDFVAMRFLEPTREDRLIQARPLLYALYRRPPAGNFSGQLVPPTPEMSQVWLQWVHPLQSGRGGTDKPANLTFNVIGGTGGIPQNVGGTFGGSIPATKIYARDDPNEDYDVFVLHGTVPGYRVLNNHYLLPMGGMANQNAGLNFDWYLDFVGYKYVMEPVSASEYGKLKDYKMKFQPVVVGGVPQSSLIRAGGVK